MMTWAVLKKKYAKAFATERGGDGEYPGWIPLIDAALTLEPEITLFCVKEKFGSMRITPTDWKQVKHQEYLVALEFASKTICSECGAPRERHLSGRCSSCRRGKQ